MKLFAWNRSRLPVAGALLASLLLLAGCGSGGTSSETAAALTKAQYVKQADAICAKVEKRQLKLVGAFQKLHLKQSPSSELKLVRFAGIPPLDTQAEELAALSPPTTEAKEASAFIKAFEAGVAEAEKNPGLLLKINQDPFAKARALASSYGFKVCRGA